MGMVGTPYSEIAAFRSAGLGFSWLESVLREQDMRHIFCSELAAAAYSNIGVMPMSAPQRWSPTILRSLRSREVLLRPLRDQMKHLLAILAVTLSLSGCQGRPVTAERPRINIPLACRQTNWRGSNGQGSCVWATTVSLFRGGKAALRLRMGHAESRQRCESAGRCGGRLIHRLSDSPTPWTPTCISWSGR